MLKVLNNITEDFKNKPNLPKILAEKYHQKESDIKLWLAQTEWSQQQIQEKTIEETQQQLLDLNLVDKTLPFNRFIIKN